MAPTVKGININADPKAAATPIGARSVILNPPAFKSEGNPF